MNTTASARKLSVAEWSECHIPPDFAAVTEAMAFVEDYCRARGLRKSLWPNMLLAMTEAANNAVEHGCKGLTPASPDALPIRLKWSWQGSRFTMEITDPGSFVPPPGHGELPTDPTAEGGRGAYLIAQLALSVQHTLTESSHSLRLEFDVGEPTWTPGDAAELEETINSMAEDLSTSYENISALFRFAEELATSDTFGAFTQKALKRLLALVRGNLAYLRLLHSDDQQLHLTSSLASQGGSVTPLQPLVPVASAWTEATACAGRRELTVEDCAALQPGDPMRNIPGSAVVAPVFFQEGIVGCLVVTRPLGAEYFSAGETALVRVVADFLGVVYTTHVLQQQRQAQLQLRRELQIASDIQQSLLPRHFPHAGDYRVFGLCHSAQHVGGDYFDVIELPERNGMLLVMADVMGKGVPASLLASNMRSAVRARTALAEDPGRLLTELNHQLVPDLERLEMFITAQIVWVSQVTHEMLLANAGHCPLIVIKGVDSQPLLAGKRSFPIGIMPTAQFESETIPLPPGSRVLMLTDGLYEVENEAEEMLGQQALAARLPELWECDDPARFCERLLHFVRGYCSAGAMSDDCTLLAFQRVTTRVSHADGIASQ
ncbi:hypothetical protein DB346_20310 [Verrucomicrobia bacterium LW23]|nr:hypothetical protein DB346_20310 [Verrucomicrobia bacterium LW23]